MDARFHGHDIPVRYPAACCGVIHSEFFQPLHEGPPDGSGKADAGLSREADRDPVSLDDDGDGHFPARAVEHFLQVLDVGIHIDIGCPVPVGHPGLRAVRSPVGAVNDESVVHAFPPLIRTAWLSCRPS